MSDDNFDSRSTWDYMMARLFLGVMMIAAMFLIGYATIMETITWTWGFVMAGNLIGIGFGVWWVHETGSWPGGVDG